MRTSLSKRVLSLLMALVMMIGMLPMNAIIVHATEAEDGTQMEETTLPTPENSGEETPPVKLEGAVVAPEPVLAATYDVYVNGVGMANGTYLANNAKATRPDKPKVGYAYYEDGVLTLYYYNCSGAGYEYNSSNGYYALIYADQDLKIVLEGENTLNQTMTEGDGIYFRLDGEISGSGSLVVSGSTYYGIASEEGNLTVNAASVTVSGGEFGLYSDQGNIIVNGGAANVTSNDYAVYTRLGSVYVTDGELTAESIDKYAVKGNQGVSFANHLTVLAATYSDDTLVPYDAANHDDYVKIMVKNYPILQGVKTIDGSVGESEDGGFIYFEDCEGVFNKPCSEETSWTVSRLRTASGALNSMPVAGETYYFDITIQGDNINFSGVTAENCDVKLSYYDVAFEKATYTDTSATITFSAVRRLTYDVCFPQYDSGQTVEAGDKAVRPEDPGVEGMHFLGWYTEDGELYDFDAPVTKNINLYAVFGHYVTFHVGETTSTQFVADGKTMTEPIPSKEGYAFRGWYTADNKYYDFTTPVTGDLELYAKLVKVHTVTITVRESTFTQIVEDGKTAIKPGISGNGFIGWYTADDQPYDFSTPVTGDLEIYAKFAENYTVTYYAGTIVVSSRTVVDGNTAEKIAAPALDGIFMGWCTEDGEPYDFTTPVTQDLSLYATYAEVALDGVLLLDGYYLPSKSTTPTKTKPAGGYAYYKDGTLTLNNYSNTGVAYLSDSDYFYSSIYAPADLNIVLAEGTSNTIINNMPVYGVEQWCNAIYVVGDLTITGNGSLTAACADYAIRAGSLTADIASFRASGRMYITDKGALSMELSGSFLSDSYIQAGTVNIKAKGDITLSSDEDSAYVQNYAETGSSSLISETGKVEIVSFSWTLNNYHDLTVSAADTIYLESINSYALGGSEGNLTLTAPNGITIKTPSNTSYVWDKLTATATNGTITVYGSLTAGEFDIRAKDDVTVNGGYIECSYGEGSIVSESGNVSISSSGRSVDMYGDVTINAAKNISITEDGPLGSTSYMLYGEGNLNLTAGENIELLTNSGYLGDLGGFNATATNGDFVAEGELYTDTINIKAKGDVTMTDSHMSIYEDEAHSIVSETGNVTLSFTDDCTLAFYYGNMTVSAAKKLTITSPDYYAIYACGNVTLTAGEGMEINSHPGYYIYCSGQQFIANVTGGDFVANSTFRVDNMTVAVAGDVTIHGQLESSGLAKISSLNGDILISAPSGKEALYYGDYYFKAPNGTTTITSDVNNSRYGLINHVDTITAEGPLKIVNPGGYALMDELKITGDEVTIIGDPTGTSDDPLTYENRNGKAYAVYEGTSEAALTAADHEAAGEVYVGYLDTGVVKFVEEDYVSTQPVKKLALELEGFDTDSELLILKGKVTGTGATIRPGGYTRGVDVLEDSDGSPGYSTTKTRLNPNTDYWVKFMVRAIDGYSLADITAADVTLKGYEDITPILSYDEDSEILTLFFPMPQLKPVVRVGGVKMHNGEYLDESGKIHTTALTDNYAYFKDGVLTLHNYDYTGAGYKYYEEYYEGTYYSSEAAIHSRYDLEIVLDAGTVNTLNADDYAIVLYNHDGSFVGAALTISGTGKLVVDAVGNGIYVASGNFAANDAELEITSAAYAIRVHGDATVTDASLDLDTEDRTIYISADLTATGSDLVINSGDYGIYVLDNVVLKDCSLELQTVKTSIYADGTISMDGCTATVNAGDAVGIGGYDIEIKNTDLTIDDCGTGMRASKYSYGGYKGSILIQDSFVEITADHDAIRTDYDVTVDNSNVIVKTTDTGSDLNYFAIRIYSPGKLVLGENLVIQGSTDPDGTLGECDLTILYNYDYIRITAPCTTHKWDSGTVTTEPGCTTEGVMTYSCKNGCSIQRTEPIEALGHYYNTGVVTTPANCVDEGVRTYTCTRCPDSYTEPVPAFGHKYDDGVITLHPTLTEKGEKLFTCQRDFCDYSYTEEIPAWGQPSFYKISPEVTQQEFDSRSANMGTTKNTYKFAAQYYLYEELVNAGYTARVKTSVYLDGGTTPHATSYDGYTPDLPGEYKIVHELLVTEPGKAEVVTDTFTHYVTIGYAPDFDTMLPKVTQQQLKNGKADLGTLYEAPTFKLTPTVPNWMGENFTVQSHMLVERDEGLGWRDVLSSGSNFTYTPDLYGKYRITYTQSLYGHGSLWETHTFVYTFNYEHEPLTFENLTPAATDAELAAGLKNLGEVTEPVVFSYDLPELTAKEVALGYKLRASLDVYDKAGNKISGLAGEVEDGTYTYTHALLGKHKVVLNLTLYCQPEHEGGTAYSRSISMAYELNLKSNYQLAFVSQTPAVTAAEAAAGKTNLGEIESGMNFTCTYTPLPDWMKEQGYTVTNYTYDYVNGAQVGFGNNYPCSGGGDHVLVMTLVLKDPLGNEVQKVEHTYTCYVKPAAAESLKITNGGTIYMDLGSNSQKLLQAQILPLDAVQIINWSSSDESIVTVDDGGMLQAVNYGRATITATNVDGTVSDTCMVFVQGAPFMVDGVYLQPGQYLAQGSRKPTAAKPADNYVYYGLNADGDMQLTLHNYTFDTVGYYDGSNRYAVYSEDFLVIKLEGTSNVSLASAYNRTAFYLCGGAEILGDSNAVLNISNVERGFDVDGGISFEGGIIKINSGVIGIYTDGNVTIAGSDLDITAASAISTVYLKTGNLIVNAGSLTAVSTLQKALDLNGTISFFEGAYAIGSANADGSNPETFDAAKVDTYKYVYISEGEESTGLKGDVNLDGVVDMNDFVALARHIGEVEFITDAVAISNADVTGDGEVNMEDFVKIAQYIGEVIDQL